MDADYDYDQKFDEMKQYIPFLESMISRLESTGSPNPRQAQLDKIRSLRDLLLDKKKKMKMENLLKCEQVLINLYAKVEQRDTLTGIKTLTECRENEKSSLTTARSKLKSVASRQDTLPDIERLRCSDSESTSKEPALFQRRPEVFRRNYTRVLVSPDRDGSQIRPHSSADDAAKYMYSRRSPYRSPRRQRRDSPHHRTSSDRKEKKKKEKLSRPRRDLNITLEVPEESLDSLNTDDILDRILNCRDNDVDIAALRELRTQILSELKHTGANNDISELILKSYKNKKNREKNKNEAVDIEEGEISDSESEAIEKIYSNLVIVNKNKNKEKSKESEDKKQSKIQISFILDSDSDTDSRKKGKKGAGKKKKDDSDVELFPSKDKVAADEKAKNISVGKNEEKEFEMFPPKHQIQLNENVSALDENHDEFEMFPPKHKNESEKSVEDFVSTEQEDKVLKVESNTVTKQVNIDTNESKPNENKLSSSDNISKRSLNENQANFYKPMDETNLVSSTSKDVTYISTKDNVSLINKESVKPHQINVDKTSEQTDVKDQSEHKLPSNDSVKEVEEIPLLNTGPVKQPPSPKKVSEIDILLALKNEILSDTISIPGTEINTPLLHQPKVTKVASNQEIIRKKRISIENYKQKSSNKPSNSTLFLNDKLSYAENLKKQSLSLTEKECERFNLSSFLLDDSSEDEEKELVKDAFDEEMIYDDLVPKSPDNVMHVDSNTKPVIIPNEPVKNIAPSSYKSDIDMRQLPPLQQPLQSPITPSLQSPVPNFNYNASPLMNSQLDNVKSDVTKNNSNEKSKLLDPRTKREMIYPAVKNSPNPELTPQRSSSSSYPNMTPRHDMTPSYQTFEIDNNPSKKHVYAPTFPSNDSRDCRETSMPRDTHKHWQRDDNPDQNYKEDSRFRDSYSTQNKDSSRYDGNFSRNRDDNRRLEMPPTPIHYFGRSECPATPSHPFGRSDSSRTASHSYERSEAPMTPVHPFGRSEGSMTPSHSFGRLEAPSTPVHPFGRSDAPLTPAHPFGRSDAPLTPVHPFGRSDAPLTPVHPFGRSDAPMTPVHPFGRSDAPMTPVHSFGRSDAPMTPVHSFGGGDNLPNDNYNKDYSDKHPNQQKYIKDPRLNRRNDRGFERDQRSYSHDQHKNYRHNYEREQSVGRDRNTSKGLLGDFPRNIDRDRNVSRDSLPRNNYPYSSERDHKDFRTSQNERQYANQYEKDHSARDPRKYYDNEIGQSFNRYDKCNENRGPDSRRRESSVGRGMSREDHFRSENSSQDFQERYIGGSNPSESHMRTSRASSVGRNLSRFESTINKLSIHSKSAGSFTIDTSINKTFQEFSRDSLSNNTFDARRKRASSVGRTLLTREVSTERFQKEASQRTYVPPRDDFSKKRDFRRAQSVGRELAESRPQMSFGDIKADLKSYKFNCGHRTLNPITQIQAKSSFQNKSDSNNYLKNRNKGNYKTGSKNYNHRDPRMYRDQKLYPRNKQRNEKSNETRNLHNYGIVYSHDNITKGKILGQGYGVKNYKIPKLKKPEPKQETEDIANKREMEDAKAKSEKESKNRDKTKLSETKSDIKVNKNNTKANETISEEKPKSKETKKILQDEDENVKGPTEKDVRVTRSKNKISTDINSPKLSSPSTLPRKSRRAVIYHSDSDEEDIKSDAIVSKIKHDNSPSIVDNKKSITTEEPMVTNETSLTSKQTSENKDAEEALNSSFGLDDLDFFSDHMSTDPVINKIDDLIADLDNDIGSSKSGPITSLLNEDLSLDNILDNVDTKCDEDTLNEIAEVIKNDLNKSSEIRQVVPENNKSVQFEDQEKVINIKEKLSSTNLKKDDDSRIEQVNKKIEFDKNINAQTNLDKNTPLQTAPEQSAPLNDEAIVSTTEKTTQEIDDENINTDKSFENLKNVKTDISKPVHDESFPDSTNAEHNEANTQVTSSQGTSTVKVPDVSTQSVKSLSQTDSIGGILSLLKDKSKIKELLTMLDGTSDETEKLKKKLEKLSEIVSDDEDSVSVSSKAVDNINDETTSDKNFDDSKESVQNNNSLSSNQKVEDDEEMADKTINECIVATSNTTVSCEKEKYNKINTSESSIKETGDILDKIKQAQVENIDKTISNDRRSPSSLKKQQDQNTDANADEETDTEDKEENISKKNTSSEGEGDSNTNISAAEKICKNNTTLKNNKVIKGKAKKRKGNKKILKSLSDTDEKRITRSSIQPKQPQKGRKKPSRELQQLHNDIKEMFISDDILNATGIRMCRLVKLVDDKSNDHKDPEPVVVLEKYTDIGDKSNLTEKMRKPVPKSKLKETTTSTDKSSVDKQKYKPGPKSKTKLLSNSQINDPYDFDTDAKSDSYSNKDITEHSAQNSSDSDNDSVAPSESNESSELLCEVKKKQRRKRCKWQSGIITSKNKKKKPERKLSNASLDVDTYVPPLKSITIPDLNCFTDKHYCFAKTVTEYQCRLCPTSHSLAEIVPHYKKYHPHSEIPLSRINPITANEAIEQSEKINFNVISRVSTEKYTCRFCFKEYGKKCRNRRESFFWHVVSAHTGEYKSLCSECVNVKRCPFNLDIPPPPKEKTGQIIGYICQKCNFTQISLENIKTHVIGRHNDELTAVFTINLAAMSNKMISSLTNRAQNVDSTEQRVVRTTRSSHSLQESSDHSEEDDDRSDADSSKSDDIEKSTSKKKSKLQSDADSTKPEEMEKSSSKVKHRLKIKNALTFETDDNVSDITCEEKSKQPIKVENDEHETTQEVKESHVDRDSDIDNDGSTEPVRLTSDVFSSPHFKVKLLDTGAKEYVCCINGSNNHYKTSLLISMKKHIQTKHSESWDGFCCVCKLIVTTLGQHSFKECLQHFIDKHADNFPIYEAETTEKPAGPEEQPPENVQTASSPRSETHDFTPPPPKYINVRPLSQLISTAVIPEETISLPKIESVVSLGDPIVSPGASTSPIQTTFFKTDPPKVTKYEEVQALVMAQKHRVVLETMLARKNVSHVFKCAAPFCSFTSDSAEDVLTHVSTHERVGGDNAFNCVYCDFDSSRNVIDLVSHVFKVHSHCQFSCGKCFYRAAASQLVGAHYIRMHKELPGDGSVYKNLHLSPSLKDETSDMLVREKAVSFYLCRQMEDGAACRFCTYIPEKLREHMQTRHGDACTHPCALCPQVLNSVKELIEHCSVHNLNHYQCVWCVFGAGDEKELLSHASEKHPNKKPLAYLRIVRQKDDTQRVLPLAHLNKLKVPVLEISPIPRSGDPVREAERATELQKLIAGTTKFIESAASGEVPENTLNEEDSLNLSQVTNTSTEDTIGSSSQLASLLLTPDNIDSIPIITESELATQLLSEQINQDNVEMILPTFLPNETARCLTPRIDDEVERTVPQDMATIIKTEPNKTAVKNVSSEVILCLDSDDEVETPKTEDQTQLKPEETQQVVDLSLDDDTPISKSAKTIKVPDDKLFKCPECKGCYKRNGFTRHLGTCLESKKQYTCAHCTFLVQRPDILPHYIAVHKLDDSFFCGICKETRPSVPEMKVHFKAKHPGTKMVVTKSQQPNGITRYIITGETKASVPAKRKASTGVATSGPSKKKRYGPDNVNELPINPILDELVQCALCDFTTKVRLNMVRHLQLHSEQQPVPHTAPVNPVPHLETNEMHFDKMLNLASSSFTGTKPQDKPREETPLQMVSAEAATRYPKYVSDRQRYTCGAEGCSYTSVDEAMLRRHWDTLHERATEYRCVHCPPYQQLDTSRPLIASRIITHLKMHDAQLFACSICSYYHYKKELVDKHLAEVHRSGVPLLVRDVTANPPATNAQAAPTNVPTMDLKPWQCGLCKFKSMLRPEVVEHCAKYHHSKMQYKCSYCPFRTSALENVTRHQASSHAGKKEDVFYFYYREDSIPNEPDGTPRWMLQRDKMPNSAEPEVKAEVSDSSSTTTDKLMPPISLPTVDITKVKKEKDEDVVDSVKSQEELCRQFGALCEPNGLKYKCPLCKLVTEEKREVMQSHLFEELRYRKWSCGICMYGAFHKQGLSDHMKSEHRKSSTEPIPLPVNHDLEAWVLLCLEYQTNAISKNKTNISIQKPQVEKLPTSPLIAKDFSEILDNPGKFDVKDLERAFGSFGTTVNGFFCCPKCNTFTTHEESAMRDHLDFELNKIRWRCSTCSTTFQNYHEAQFHCRLHAGDLRPARPVEAIRAQSTRLAWVAAVVNSQKPTVTATTSSTVQRSPLKPIQEPIDDPENSLLVVRYEEKVPTPEGAGPSRDTSIDYSDEDRLVIDSHGDSDEEVPYGKQRRKQKQLPCPHCDYTGRAQYFLQGHILGVHYNLKQFRCGYCDYSAHNTKLVKTHTEDAHPTETVIVKHTEIPAMSPAEYKDQSPNASICFECEKIFSEPDTKAHLHNNESPEFGKRGDVVVKCQICLTLVKNTLAIYDHHNNNHSGEPINCTYYKLGHDTRDSLICAYCEMRFKYLNDLKAHHGPSHESLPLKYTRHLKYFKMSKHAAQIRTPEKDNASTSVTNKIIGPEKRKLSADSTISAPKRIAKKSTTKLPSQTIAKKSTTKLPLLVFPIDSDDESEDEYSYYGTKPTPLDELSNVTTLMPFCNTIMPFTMKKLSEIIKINPKVVVKDIKK